MGRYKQFIVKDTSNVFYTDPMGENKYDANIRGAIIMVDTTKPFSSNLIAIVDNTFVEKGKLSWYKFYLKEWGGLIGRWLIVAFVLSIMYNLFAYKYIIYLYTCLASFTGGIIITSVILSIIDWKKKE